MAGLTLDTGALIAAERGDDRVWAYLRGAKAKRVIATIPAPVLAQAWRGGARGARLAMLLGASIVEILDEDRAKAIGELCGETGTSDIVDASVIVSAASRRDTVLTGDPEDLRALAAIAGRVRIVGLADLGDPRR